MNKRSDKALEARVAQLEERYRLIADNLVDAIWVADADSLQIVFITPSIERLSGFTPEEYQGLAPQETMTPSSYQKVMKALGKGRKQLEQGISIKNTIELEMVHKNGHVYWVELTSRFLQEAGEPLRIVGVTSDITQRKTGEKKREDLIQELGQALAEKERLLTENRVLRELLPICSGCKRIRDEQGNWWPLDLYVSRRTEARLTHTICPDCRRVIYPEV